MVDFVVKNFYLSLSIRFYLTAIGAVVDKLNIGSVAYSICFHSRLKQVIFGIPEGKEIIFSFHISDEIQ
jgi:hypothetical protein